MHIISDNPIHLLLSLILIYYFIEIQLDVECAQLLVEMEKAIYEHMPKPNTKQGQEALSKGEELKK